MEKKKKKATKNDVAVPVRRKQKPFKKVTELGIGGFVDSVKDEFFNRFPEVVNLASEPRINIKESDKKFTVFAAVAGMDKEDVDIEVDKNSVRISGEYREEEETKEGKWLKVEREYGSFSRAFTLPSPIRSRKS
jgi:HSP20 family molecular chaperone IbpA